MQDRIAEIIETNCPFVEQWDTSECAAKIIAALPDMVQPLVWGNHGDGCRAETLNGEYHCHPTANTQNQKFVVYYICPKRMSWTVGYKEGVEAAKAAAQADYTRRILSAFGITGET